MLTYFDQTVSELAEIGPNPAGAGQLYISCPRTLRQFRQNNIWPPPGVLAFDPQTSIFHQWIEGTQWPVTWTSWPLWLQSFLGSFLICPTNFPNDFKTPARFSLDSCVLLLARLQFPADLRNWYTVSCNTSFMIWCCILLDRAAFLYVVKVQRVSIFTSKSRLYKFTMTDRHTQIETTRNYIQKLDDTEVLNAQKAHGTVDTFL